MTMHVVPSPVHHTAAQIARITSFMPPPRGSDLEALSKGYFDSLKAFPADAIREAVDGFLSGRFGERKWLPLPPELATMVRACLGHGERSSPGRPYAYRKPNSRLLKGGCTKEWVREMRRRGEFEPGVIWTPGPYGENAEWGDLWAPDPGWQPAVRIPTKEEDDARKKAEEANEAAAGSFTPRFVSPRPK